MSVIKRGRLERGSSSKWSVHLIIIITTGKYWEKKWPFLMVMASHFDIFYDDRLEQNIKKRRHHRRTSQEAPLAVNGGGHFNSRYMGNQNVSFYYQLHKMDRFTRNSRQVMGCWCCFLTEFYISLYADWVVVTTIWSTQRNRNRTYWNGDARCNYYRQQGSAIYEQFSGLLTIDVHGRTTSGRGV